MHLKSNIYRFFAAAVLVTAVQSAYAQTNYPRRPVTIIVPYSPGAATDILARAAAQKLTEHYGQQVLVSNRDGATGAIGTDMVAKAAPDGQTLLWGSSSPLAINPVYSGKLPYDSVKDFTPITLFSVIPYILVIHPSIPAKSLKDLIALARAHPGRMNYASSGAGGAPQLSAELMKSMAGIDIVHVPYRGTSLFMTDLLSGQVALAFTGIATSMGHVKQGRLRVLAITSSQRSPHAPDIPTLSESGLPGYELTNWYGLVGPAALPKDIVASLHAGMLKALEQNDVKQRIAQEGATPSGAGPEQFSALIKSELAKYGKLIREAKLKPD
jgi:tripartite-type tricarboxylate transporter receptor subunit TctC